MMTMMIAEKATLLDDRLLYYYSHSTVEVLLVQYYSWSIIVEVFTYLE